MKGKLSTTYRDYNIVFYTQSQGGLKVINRLVEKLDEDNDNNKTLSTDESKYVAFYLHYMGERFDVTFFSMMPQYASGLGDNCLMFTPVLLRDKDNRKYNGNFNIKSYSSSGKKTHNTNEKQFWQYSTDNSFNIELTEESIAVAKALIDETLDKLPGQQNKKPIDVKKPNNPQVDNVPAQNCDEALKQISKTIENEIKSLYENDSKHKNLFNTGFFGSDTMHYSDKKLRLPKPIKEIYEYCTYGKNDYVALTAEQVCESIQSIIKNEDNTSTLSKAWQTVFEFINKILGGLHLGPSTVEREQGRDELNRVCQNILNVLPQSLAR